MIKLIIKNSDESPYWTEYFSSNSEALKWLNEEKTRSYWKTDFVVEIEDRSAEIQAELEARILENQKKREELKAKKQAIKILIRRDERDIRLPDLIQLVKQMAELLGLDEETV